jgi:hypothetical protein
MADAVIGEIPVSAAPDFQIYNSRTLVAKTMDLVWAKQMAPEAAIEALTKQWQSGLDAG